MAVRDDKTVSTDTTMRAALKAPGFYKDRDVRGLYLKVSSAKAASWVLRYMLRGKQREMGLGSARDIGLATARKLAAQAREQKGAGVDPLDARDAASAAERARVAGAITFQNAADQYMAENASEWRNAKHAKQWATTLQSYAYPTLGKQPVRAITVDMVADVLRPIWLTIPETANRLRGRIWTVLDTVLDDEANPARLQGPLRKRLPKRSKRVRDNHHAALPYADIPQFMAELRAQPGTAARALEFAILTAGRTSEVLGATAAEIVGDTWTIPGDRMKAGREHRVPLSPAALALVKEPGHILFQGRTGAEPKPLSNMALLMTLRRMGRGDLTAHGFRSCFKDWATETTGFPPDVSEAALAHAVRDKTIAAYQRGDLFEKRRKLMAAWAAYCAKPATGNIVPMHKAGNV